MGANEKKAGIWLVDYLDFLVMVEHWEIEAHHQFQQVQKDVGGQDAEEVTESQEVIQVSHLGWEIGHPNVII